MIKNLSSDQEIIYWANGTEPKVRGLQTLFEAVLSQQQVKSVVVIREKQQNESLNKTEP